MTNSAPDAGPVAKQYEKWVYPFPIQDLSAPELRERRDGGDYTHNWYTYWPNREPREDLDVLVAGCGSNAAARYAYNHPKARVVGIDLSASSLAHEKYLKDKHNLTNLTLHQGKLQDVGKIGRQFDFIDCSGVLHHLPDPVEGLRALGSVLRPDGTIAIMVYGRHGRVGVYMLQEMFRLMRLGQTEADVGMVKQVLEALPKRHVIQDYMSRVHDTKYDAGLVDTFLHRQDRAYTASQCVAFAQDAGLSFMHWWDNILYYPEGQLSTGGEIYKKLANLPEIAVWDFMELYNGTLGQHAFAVCHPTRPTSSYRLDFQVPAFLDYVPVLRAKIGPAAAGAQEGAITLERAPFGAVPVSPALAALTRQIDGKKTIRDCYLAAKLSGPGLESMEETCRVGFRHLWRLSEIFLRIPG